MFEECSDKVGTRKSAFSHLVELDCCRESKCDIIN